MKKSLLVVLVAALVLFCSVAFADTEINFAGKLELGMDMQQASAVSGFKITDYSKNPIQWTADIEAKGIHNFRLVSGYATVGGFDVEVTVYFDENDKVKMIRYKFDDVSQEAYDKIEASLEKYTSDAFTGEKPIRAYKSNYPSSSDREYWQTYTVKQEKDRMIPYHDGSLQIEHGIIDDEYWTYSKTNKSDSYKSNNTIHFVSYTYYDFVLGNDGGDYTPDF